MHLLHRYVRCEDDEQWYIECTVCFDRKPVAFKVTEDDPVDPTEMIATNAEPPALWLEYPDIWEYYGQEVPE